MSSKLRILRDKRENLGWGIVLKLMAGFGKTVSRMLQTSRGEMQLQSGGVGINILTRAGWRDYGIEVKTEAELKMPLLDPQR